MMSYIVNVPSYIHFAEGKVRASEIMFDILTICLLTLILKFNLATQKYIQSTCSIGDKYIALYVYVLDILRCHLYWSFRNIDTMIDLAKDCLMVKSVLGIGNLILVQ